MDEEKGTRSAPPRYRYKLIKYMTLILFFLVIFFSLGAFGLEATSSSKFCASCHEMKPEYYTWKASTHSEVDCVNCHTDTGAKKAAKDQAEEIAKKIAKKKITVNGAPIQMPNEIPDSACEKCHNISTRDVTPHGDIIIPHDKHKNKNVKCTQCHSGIAHGKVSSRKMTYPTDLKTWDNKVGTAAMADFKFTRPDMDTCIECHKARQVTTECKACHSTGMIPKSHKKEEFKTTHGIQAGQDLQKCNQCHKSMSKEALDNYEEGSTLTKFLHNAKQSSTKQSQYDYAKDNTFCRDCHSKRPDSHTSQFMKEHGNLASKNKQKCLACHNYQQGEGKNPSMLACSSCHPALHKNFERERHPVPLAKNQQVTNYCYTCHVKKTCSSCHKQ